MFFGGMPGGFPGGGGMGAPPRGDVDTEKLYETLGVKKDASKKEIRKVRRIERRGCRLQVVAQSSHSSYSSPPGLHEIVSNPPS